MLRYIEYFDPVFEQVSDVLWEEIRAKTRSCEAPHSMDRLQIGFQGGRDGESNTVKAVDRRYGFWPLGSTPVVAQCYAFSGFADHQIVNI